jgi:pimeloyl-[acyl-carrier protein] methyl ester esterase
MSLHVESHGSGAPLVLIHGWGMHGGIWDNVVAQLAQDFRVHCVDLPGHGYSSRDKGQDTPFSHSPYPLTLDAIVDELSAQFDEPLNVCGWSLGGLVALRWAQLAPQQVRRLVLVASTPCFAEREGWLFGMAAASLRQFAAELELDHAATLRRFLALQLRGSANERALLADMRSRLFSRGEPDVKALRGGLEILRDADLRNELASICQPALLIAGERDKLTPPAASFYMAQSLPDARVVEIAGAAHAPFLSHPEIFVEQIMDFLHG